MYSMLALINLVPSGMTNGYSAISLSYLNDPMDINLTNQEPTLFSKNLRKSLEKKKKKRKAKISILFTASIPSIFMLIGCIASIYTLTFGRRLAISVGSLANLLGWILISSSYNVPQLLIGRAVGGTLAKVSDRKYSILLIDRFFNAFESFLIRKSFLILNRMSQIEKE